VAAQPGDRRADAEGRLGDNAMRCERCGTVWYSAVAPLTVSWASCAGCGGPLHIERRGVTAAAAGRAARIL
jgi:hypothetical protein